MGSCLFENIKLYVGFTDASSAALRELPPGRPSRSSRRSSTTSTPPSRPTPARAPAITGRRRADRPAQADADPLDRQAAARARTTRRTTSCARASAACTSASRCRRRTCSRRWTGSASACSTSSGRKLAGDPDKLERIATALNQILDLELAIMLETYREDLEAKHRNAERLATIGQFAASIGHELRNPLGVVESSLYLAAPAPRRAGGGRAARGQAPRSHRQRGPAREQDHPRPPGPGPQPAAAAAPRPRCASWSTAPPRRRCCRAAVTARRGGCRPI